MTTPPSEGIFPAQDPWGLSRRPAFHAGDDIYYDTCCFGWLIYYFEAGLFYRDYLFAKVMSSNTVASCRMLLFASPSFSKKRAGPRRMVPDAGRSEIKHL